MASRNVFERVESVAADDRSELAFYRIAGLYAGASDEDRARIRASWPFARRWKIPDDRTLATERPGLPPSRERARAALLYHSIEDCRHDWRDNLVSICAIHHSLVRLGLDAARLFEEVAALSSGDTARILRGWIARKPGDQSLAAFGWREEKTAEGWRLAGW